MKMVSMMTEILQNAKITTTREMKTGAHMSQMIHMCFSNIDFANRILQYYLNDLEYTELSGRMVFLDIMRREGKLSEKRPAVRAGNDKVYRIYNNLVKMVSVPVYQENTIEKVSVKTIWHREEQQQRIWRSEKQQQNIWSKERQQQSKWNQEQQRTIWNRDEQQQTIWKNVLQNTDRERNRQDRETLPSIYSSRLLLLWSQKIHTIWKDSDKWVAKNFYHGYVNKTITESQGQKNPEQKNQEQKSQEQKNHGQKSHGQKNPEEGQNSLGEEQYYSGEKVSWDANGKSRFAGNTILRYALEVENRIKKSSSMVYIGIDRQYRFYETVVRKGNFISDNHSEMDKFSVKTIWNREKQQQNIWNREEQQQTIWSSEKQQQNIWSRERQQQSKWNQEQQRQVIWSNEEQQQSKWNQENHWQTIWSSEKQQQTIWKNIWNNTDWNRIRQDREVLPSIYSSRLLFLWSQKIQRIWKDSDKWVTKNFYHAFVDQFISEDQGQKSQGQKNQGQKSQGQKNPGQKNYGQKNHGQKNPKEGQISLREVQYYQGETVSWDADGESHFAGNTILYHVLKMENRIKKTSSTSYIRIDRQYQFYETVVRKGNFISDNHSKVEKVSVKTIWNHEVQQQNIWSSEEQQQTILKNIWNNTDWNRTRQDREVLPSIYSSRLLLLWSQKIHTIWQDSDKWVTENIYHAYVNQSIIESQGQKSQGQKNPEEGQTSLGEVQYYPGETVSWDVDGESLFAENTILHHVLKMENRIKKTSSMAYNEIERQYQFYKMVVRKGNVISDNHSKEEKVSEKTIWHHEVQQQNIWNYEQQRQTIWKNIWNNTDRDRARQDREVSLSIYSSRLLFLWSQKIQRIWQDSDNRATENFYHAYVNQSIIESQGQKSQGQKNPGQKNYGQKNPEEGQTFLGEVQYYSGEKVSWDADGESRFAGNTILRYALEVENRIKKSSSMVYIGIDRQYRFYETVVRKGNFISDNRSKVEKVIAKTIWNREEQRQIIWGSEEQQQNIWNYEQQRQVIWSNAEQQQSKWNQENQRQTIWKNIWNNTDRDRARQDREALLSIYSSHLLFLWSQRIHRIWQDSDKWVAKNFYYGYVNKTITENQEQKNQEQKNYGQKNHGQKSHGQKNLEEAKNSLGEVLYYPGGTVSWDVDRESRFAENTILHYALKMENRIKKSSSMAYIEIERHYHFYEKVVQKGNFISDNRSEVEKVSVKTVWNREEQRQIIWGSEEQQQNIWNYEQQRQVIWSNAEQQQSKWNQENQRQTILKNIWNNTDRDRARQDREALLSIYSSRLLLLWSQKILTIWQDSDKWVAKNFYHGYVNKTITESQGQKSQGQKNPAQKNYGQKNPEEEQTSLGEVQYYSGEKVSLDADGESRFAGGTILHYALKMENRIKKSSSMVYIGIDRQYHFYEMVVRKGNFISDNHSVMEKVSEKTIWNHEVQQQNIWSRERQQQSKWNQENQWQTIWSRERQQKKIWNSEKQKQTIWNREEQQQTIWSSEKQQKIKKNIRISSSRDLPDSALLQDIAEDKETYNRINTRDNMQIHEKSDEILQKELTLHKSVLDVEDNAQSGPVSGDPFAVYNQYNERQEQRRRTLQQRKTGERIYTSPKMGRGIPKEERGARERAEQFQRELIEERQKNLEQKEKMVQLEKKVLKQEKQLEILWKKQEEEKVKEKGKQTREKKYTEIFENIMTLEGMRHGMDRQ